MTGATYTASTQAATDSNAALANLASGHAAFAVPPAINEPTLSYRPGSPEREALKASLKHLTEQKIDVPVVIGHETISSGEKRDMRMPHAHGHLLGHYHSATGEDVKKALATAANAKAAWAAMPWQDRAAIFLKAADLLAGPYRSVLNAVTMAAQSKTAFQAEIDSACELIDFIRFNVQFMQQIYQQQPASAPGVWNRMEYRPLEGFVLAVTPFNFTAIAGNLPMSAALMGNVVLWKPASSVVYTAWHVMKLWEMAGLPDGVITMLPGAASEIVDPLLDHPDLAGVHFTGSTGVFHHIWKRVGENIGRFRTYPRLVGETGGKDFVFAHASADPREVATALVRGAFEFQGQKCSAGSRAYIPHVLWPHVREHMLSEISHIKVGDVADFRNFMGAVIDRDAFKRIKGYIEFAKADEGCETVAEGILDDSKGYFVGPHVFRAHEPDFRTMREEIFGPVLTVYVYDEKRFEETLAICDQTSPYALTGSIFARDRRAIALAAERLQNAAGNFYINDKPTGAVVGQQPFGGARASGTNDKAGSVLNLLRWVSPRTIKETFVPPTDFRYSFMESE